MGMKYAHDLHTAKDVDALQQKLLSKGIDIVAVVESVVPDTSDAYGIIFTGSIVEKNGNGLSDLDVQVLYDTLSEEELEAAIMQSDNILGRDNWKEVVQYISGVEINIGFHSFQELEKLRDLMSGLAPALIDPKELKVFAIIGQENLHFMHELRAGWVCQGENVIKKWRNLLLVDALEIYLSIHYYVKSLTYLQDAFSNLGLFSKTPTYMGVLCLKYCLLGLLANVGFTSQREKWFYNFCSRIEDEAYQSLVKDGLELYHPDMKTVTKNQESEHAFLRHVYAYHLKVRQQLSENEMIGKVLDHITEKFEFVLNSSPTTT